MVRCSRETWRCCLGLMETLIWLVASTCICAVLHYLIHRWDMAIYERWERLVEDRTITQYNESDWSLIILAFAAVFIAPMYVFCRTHPEQRYGLQLVPILLLIIPNLLGLFFWAMRHRQQKHKRRGFWRRGGETGPRYFGEPRIEGLHWRAEFLIIGSICAVLIALFFFVQ